MVVKNFLFKFEQNRFLSNHISPILNSKFKPN